MVGAADVESGFVEWFDENAARLTRAVTMLAGGDVPLAQDCVQEACAKALVSWKRVSRMDNPTGWVYRTAVNGLRRTARRPAREERLDGLRVVISSSDEPAPEDPLWSLVDGLPERMRAAVVLRYVADLQEQTVADVLGTSRGGVSSLLVKARTRLRTALVEEAEHG